MKCGVMYIGTDRFYLEQAIESVKTLKETNDIPASIVISEELECHDGLELFDSVIALDNTYDDLRDKIYNFSRSPYDRTIYLDGDTYIIGDISDVFDILDRVDIAAVMSPVMYTVDIPDIPNCFPKMNTGVVAYKSSPEVDEMLNLWKQFLKRQMETGRPMEGESIGHPNYNSLEELSSFGNMYGEVPFREAVYKSTVDWSFLPPEYNYCRSGMGYTEREVKILHSNHREELSGIINKSKKPRIIVGDKLYTIHQHHSTSIRLAGIPIVEPVLHYINVPDIMHSLGIYEETRAVYQKLTELYDRSVK